MSLTNPLVSNFNFMQLSQVPNKTISDKFILHIFANHNRSLPAAHHGEVCDIITSSVGSYRSQYITISSSFTDVFLPSSPHNTSIRLVLRRLCYRRCLIAGTYPSEAIIAKPTSNPFSTINFCRPSICVEPALVLMFVPFGLLLMT